MKNKSKRINVNKLTHFKPMSLAFTPFDLNSDWQFYQFITNHSRFSKEDINASLNFRENPQYFY